MNTIFNQISDFLYEYVCGDTTAKKTKEYIANVGYKVDLRKWNDNVIEIESIKTGELFEIEV